MLLREKVCFLAGITSIFLSHLAVGQSSLPTDAPQISVIYQQRIDGKEVPSATLVVQNKKALYYFNRTEGAASNEIKQVDETHYVVESIDAEGTCVYHNTAAGKVLSREFDFSTKKFILISDSLPDFKWNITSATRKIGQYQVQQATTTFRGREYDVWFAPDIPLAFGPWKLLGLPGLILEARDKTGQISFQALQINQPAAVATPVVPPTQGHHYPTWIAYWNNAREAEARLAKFMQARSPNTTVKISRDGALEVTP